MTVGDRIRRRREEIGMSQKELAEKVGYKDRSSINLIEKNKRDIRQLMISKIAKALDISPAYIIGLGDEQPPTQPLDQLKLKKIPLLGNVACGEPIFAIKDADEYVPLFDDVKADFCVRAKGDSMTGANIYDGDIIFAHSQNMVDNGEIAVVIIGEEAALKRVYYYPQENKLLLASENPKYAPLSYSGRELEQVRIIGKAVVHYGIIK